MIRLFIIALQFLTRVRVSKSVIPSEDEIGRAAAYFPLVGALVGGSAVIFYRTMNLLLPAPACVVLVIAYTAFITNAFHEDGWADSFDGFGGGWKRDNVLTIMRDSRIGSYGALALILLVLAKYSALSQLAWPQLWRALIVGHVASRWAVLPLCLWLPYAREEGQGKLVARNVRWGDLIIASAILVATTLLFPWRAALCMVVGAITVVALSGWYFQRRLGGVTGDCLGAVNQLTEATISLLALAVQNFFAHTAAVLWT